MADGFEALCSWSAEGTTVEEIEAATARLRAGEQQAATRTSVVNLVIVASDQESLTRAGSAMRRLGARHPGRTVLALIIPDGEAGIDATVTINQSVAEGHRVWWEELSLVVSGPGAAHLDSIVLPLLLHHLPLAVWFPGSLPDPGDRLAEAADVLLVDVRFAEPLGSPHKDVAARLAAIAELASVHTVTDLSWKRLAPWRELLAACFEPSHLRPYLAGVHSASVRAQPGPQRLLAGWLSSKLSLSPDKITMSDALHAGMSLHSRLGDDRATIKVSRAGGGDLVKATVCVEGTEKLCLTEQLPEHGLTRSLARALSEMRSDPTYELALSTALEAAR